MYDPVSGTNRGFCLSSNKSMPQRIFSSCERTSLKVVFEVVIRMQDVCVCVCALVCVSMSVCDLGYVFSSGLGIMESSLFSFFSSFALQVAPTIWRQALKTRPSLSHQNGMKIYPHIPSRPVALSRVSRRLQAQITGLVGWMEYRGIWWVNGDPTCGFWGWKYTWKCIRGNLFCGRLNSKQVVQP